MMTSASLNACVPNLAPAADVQLRPPVTPRRTLLIGLLIGPLLAWIDVTLGTLLPADGRLTLAIMANELAAGAAAFLITYGLGAVVIAAFARRPASRRAATECLIALLVTAIVLRLLQRSHHAWINGGGLTLSTGMRLAAAVTLIVIMRPLIARLLTADYRRPRICLMAASPAVAIVAGLIAVHRPLPARAAASFASAGPQPRCVVLLSIDTLRADALRAYSPLAPWTPALSALAADSTVFEQAVSPAPWTLPAFASMLTGLSPDIHGVRNFASRVPDECPTVAQHLSAAGYRTAAIGYNPFLHAAYNLHRGFDEYRMYPRASNGSLSGALMARIERPGFAATVDTPCLTDMAIDWIDKHANQPFFLWLHYFDPHQPYEPPAGFRPDRRGAGRIGDRLGTEVLDRVRTGYFVPSREELAAIRDLYDAEVRYVDAHVARVVDRLKRHGLYEQALIVVVSDHGEEFWEHGGFEHGHSVYQELLHVPLFIKPPGTPRPRRVSEPVDTTSLTPTLLELCRLDFDAEAYSAPSLAPSIRGDAAAASDRPIVSARCVYYEDQLALRAGNLKYIKRTLSRREELFDLANDPAERISLVASRPGEVGRMRELLREYDDRCTALRKRYAVSDSSGASLSPELLQEMRSLGYVE